MSEFTNRISAQREILKTINSQPQREELFGLSSKAIDRWIAVNDVNNESCLVQLIKDASAKLFFLANKSQEQITEEYEELASEIELLHVRIEQEMIRSLSPVNS
jgi:hypothetical protein